LGGALCTFVLQFTSHILTMFLSMQGRVLGKNKKIVLTKRNQGQTIGCYASLLSDLFIPGRNLFCLPR
jgi:hypothetical protein